MKHFPHFLFAFVVSITVNAQVGIGTPTPSAELDIITTNTGIPALELTPQSAPVGTQTGQFSVIGDQLYMYDGTRAKWLSTQATPLHFSKSGNSNGDYLLSGGNIADVNSGASLPFNGTIVHVSATSSGGNSTKGFNFYVKNGATITSTTLFNLVSNNFVKTDYNINFDAGNYINVFAVSDFGAGASVVNPSVTVWVKWRR